VTWHEYEQGLEDRMDDLHGRIHRGAFRAKPSKRVYIEKTDGKERPLGISSLEDKIAQHAVRTVLQCIYQEDFLGFSDGFRPGRSPHQALDALYVAITEKRVNWILDADVEGFFDNIGRDWLVKFIEHRVGDKRIVRLIQKWLNAGIIEGTDWSDNGQGTPQGAVIAPNGSVNPLNEGAQRIDSRPPFVVVPTPPLPIPACELVSMVGLWPLRNAERDVDPERVVASKPDQHLRIVGPCVEKTFDRLREVPILFGLQPLALPFRSESRDAVPKAAKR